MSDTLAVPDLSDAFTKKLYSTYLSYFAQKIGMTVYPLKMNVDDRGSFTEIIRTADRGTVLGEHFQTGHHKRATLASYQERKVCGGERTWADTATKDQERKRW